MKDGFHGKFRGVVTDARDPLRLGRVRARVPDVFGDGDCGWALPCAAFSGRGVGLVAVPAKGASVWVEFEQGDPERPIWVGGWWPDGGDVPAPAAPSPHERVVICTAAGNKVVIDDAAGKEAISLETKDGQKITMSAAGIEMDGARGSLVLKVTGGAKVEIGPSGIEISDGQGASVKLSGPTVSINGGALEVV